MQRTQQGFSKTLSLAVYFPQFMQQNKADSKKTLGQKKLKKLMQRMQQAFSKTLSLAVYFPQFMQQKKADSKKTLGQKKLKKAEKS